MTHPRVTKRTREGAVEEAATWLSSESILSRISGAKYSAVLFS